ncbi:MAG: SDR family NAD(P)-dependent oxidoreductase [Clostridia bacterium]|nr:SDR family NAD(P)-dependent oxidoreductase [Clostridia bacterium]
MKTVLLIGAGGGMGSACARMLLRQGYRVIGLDREGTVVPEGAAFVPIDVTDPASVQSACEALQGTALDAIAYMAGVYDTGSLIEIDEARMRRIFEVNVFGAYRAIKAFFPLLRENGRVVLVTSELAPLDPLPFTGLYGVTKGTLEQYAFSLAMELQLIGVMVSVIRPGAVETPLIGRSVERIESFAVNTEHYPECAERFLYVTHKVESRSVPPEAVAKKLIRILSAKRSRFLYTLNTSPLLKLYGILPKQWKLFAIKTYLKRK